MKRLRKKFSDIDVRFFHCGEYGEQNSRPHYHACLFNFDFSDKVLWKVVNGQHLYNSETLHQLWPFGYCVIGDVTFESAAYVARYITKKVHGDGAQDHYAGRRPEYVTMSRRPGIGKAWFDQFKGDCYPHDFIVINGKKIGLPKYYDSLLEDSELEKIKLKRKYEAYEHWENNTLRRLKDREIVHEVKADLLKRRFEDETSSSFGL